MTNNAVASNKHFVTMPSISPRSRGHAGHIKLADHVDVVEEHWARL